MCYPLNSCLILYNPHINYQTLYLICSKYCLVIEFAAALYLLTVCGFVFVLFIILTGLGICKFFCIECKFGHVNELVHNCLWSVETKRRKLYVYSLTPVSLANILLWSSLALMKRFIDISKFWSKQYAIYIFQTRFWMKFLGIIGKSTLNILIICFISYPLKVNQISKSCKIQIRSIN